MLITNDEILELIEYFYNIKPENGAGGCLHNVLDDGNLSDNDIKWCINYAKENEDFEAVLLAYVLLGLSEKQRENIYIEYWLTH